MAITFLGSAKSYIQMGNDGLTQTIFTIENGIESRVNLNIRRFVFQNDAIGLLTTVMPLVKTSRGTAISGGTILEKGSFDTAKTSDPNVICRAQVMESARITATPSNIIWQQYPNRLHTAAEQQMCGNQNLLPYLVSDAGKEFKLRPGESLVCQVVSPTVATNAALSNNWWAECVFEEDSVPTFAIGGTVTLNSSPVTGAKVTVVECDDINMTNPILIGVITTPAGGVWSSTIRTGKIGYAYVQYQNDGNFYTAPGSPYLS